MLIFKAVSAIRNIFIGSGSLTCHISKASSLLVYGIEINFVAIPWSLERPPVFEKIVASALLQSYLRILRLVLAFVRFWPRWNYVSYGVR